MLNIAPNLLINTTCSVNGVLNLLALNHIWLNEYEFSTFPFEFSTSPYVDNTPVHVADQRA
jgi:hypothetical protein